MPGQTLSWSQAIESPCSTCRSTPCCTHLPLQTFRVGALADLDYVRYLLNFDRIVVGLGSAGDWGAYLAAPCRHLDIAAGLCRVHAQPAQPHICATYNPYVCWYKTAFGPEADGDLLRIDLQRWQYLAERTTFDEDRKIVSAPVWQELAEAFADIPLEHHSQPASPAIEASLSPPLIPVKLSTKPDPRQRSPLPARGDYPPQPCAGCAAPCCTNLLFPQPLPENAGQLDFIKFALGFPGVRLMATADEWMLAVSAHCRHLEGSLCSVYGKPERPLRCVYYDEWSCIYKPRLGPTPSEDVALLELEAFAALEAEFKLDEDQRIFDGPSIEEMRHAAQLSRS
jgi:hypothetical protein